MYKIRLQRDFYKTCSNLANHRSDKRFLSTSKFPPGLSAPDLCLCIFIKSWKDVYKVRGWRDFFETCNKWPKWWGLSVDIKSLALMGCLSLSKGYIHIYDHEKMCIKSEGRAIFWNMQPVIKVIRPFCFHQKIVPNGCLLLPWDYIHKQYHMMRNTAKGPF